MTLESFLNAPWKTSHRAYLRSAFAITPAPEYANSEVLIASLYRVIGYRDTKEGQVPDAGKELETRLNKMRDRRQSSPENATLAVESWHTVLHGVLESPKLFNQSSKRFLQTTPLVPSLALISGSARLSSNPWSPGMLVRRMVWLGSENHAVAAALWKDLFLALTVGDDDDVFARWLKQETEAWGIDSPWEFVPVSEEDAIHFSGADFLAVKFLPARQFVKDLRSAIQAKGSMTRRQWTSLMESILRLATVVHVTWLCDVQTRIWQCLFNVVSGAVALGADEVRMQIFPESPEYMTYGGRALNGLKDKASGYLAARLYINALLWTLASIGRPFDGDLSSSHEIAALCEHVRRNQTALEECGFAQAVESLLDGEARALGCNKGVGANMLEFARHALGQRIPAVHLLRGYDQGYVLKKKGTHSSSPWVVALGPVAVLALVHCALADTVGPRSIQRLAQHLAEYGIAIDRYDIARNDLGHQLRMLGLVLDSPDAESGMLLLPPFPNKHVDSTQ